MQKYLLPGHQVGKFANGDRVGGCYTTMCSIGNLKIGYVLVDWLFNKVPKDLNMLCHLSFLTR